MSAHIEITKINLLQDLSAVEEIFFLTAAIQEFKSNESRNAFKYKYLSFYLEKYADFCFVAKKEGVVLGYCLGSPLTDENFYSYQPHLELFSDLYESFPAHLHINLHPKAQGLGIGQLLMEEWERFVKENSLAKGLHIMTAPDARNRRFYQRLGLVVENVRIFKGHSVLFMGKSF